MKIIKNPLLDTWEMAESTEIGPRTPGDLTPVDLRRILIVDDDARIRELYKKIVTFSFPDFTVELVCDGKQAVEKFSANHHAVVVLDYLMPQMNGEEAFFEIARLCEEREWEKPSFLFCTGCNPPQSLHNAVACDPANCLLRKPVRAEILKQAIASRLHR